MVILELWGTTTRYPPQNKVNIWVYRPPLQVDILVIALIFVIAEVDILVIALIFVISSIYGF